MPSLAVPRAHIDHVNQCYWLNITPAFEPARPALPARAGIVILGAGIMGSALAYHLAAAGQSVWVLERNVHPAGGATGRNGGLVVGGPSQSYNTAIHKLGSASAREITQLTRESIDAGCAVTGFVSLAAQPDELADLKASAEALRAVGFAAKWLALLVAARPDLAALLHGPAM